MEEKGKSFVYEELKALLDRNFGDFHNLKETAKTLMGLASISIPVVAAISSRADMGFLGFLPDWVPVFFRGLSLGMYIAIMVLCIWVISPTRVIGPLKPSKEQFEAFFFNQEENAVLDELIERYTHVIESNGEEMKALVIRTRIAGILLGIVNVLLLAIIL